MKLYKTTRGILAQSSSRETFHPVPIADWDSLIMTPNLQDVVRESLSITPVHEPAPYEILAPVGSQEVWAAGVTYFRSRTARMEESTHAGGGTFYDRVYAAERPELFFKAAGWRAVGNGAAVHIRGDAEWSVPEPELTLVINPEGSLVGYTIGNDMSSRDIEGENPLYLPQAKVYDGSCALGPCVLLTGDPLPKTTAIRIEILRDNATAFDAITTLAELKREPAELARYLFQDNTFPDGAFLMTGTGIVPADDFTLAHGDLIRISIDGIGTLENRVA